MTRPGLRPPAFVPAATAALLTGCAALCVLSPVAAANEPASKPAAPAAAAGAMTTPTRVPHLLAGWLHRLWLGRGDTESDSFAPTAVARQTRDTLHLAPAPTADHPLSLAPDTASLTSGAAEFTAALPATSPRTVGLAGTAAVAPVLPSCPDALSTGQGVRPAWLSCDAAAATLPGTSFPATNPRLEAFASSAPRVAGLPAGTIPAATTATSGTLTATTSYNYSTAPWMITAGDGTYPDLGGTATFTPIIGATPGTVASGSFITVDVSPTLSQIVFNSPFVYQLGAGTGTSLIAPNTGLTVNSQSSAQSVTVGTLPVSLPPPGLAITSPISGGGTAGLTKTGPGDFYLGGANTYTGGTHFNGGLTNVAATAAVGDGVFGAAGTGNGLSFNGGTVLFNVTPATSGGIGLTSARNIFIGTGGGTFDTNTATILSGVISGTGPLTIENLSAAVLTLTGASTYTGATTVQGPGSNLSSAVALTLGGTGSINASSSYDLTGTVTLDNSGTNVADRLNDTAPVTLRGVNLIDTGNASTTSSETVGAVTANNGFSTILVTPGSGAANSLTMASLARQNNATLDFRGTGLGGTPGSTVANLYSTTAPTLVGGGGAAGSTTQSILPYAIGNSTSSVLFTAVGQVSSSLVTYGTNGFRPLATAEYATAFGVNATDNVRITAATSVSASGVTANSVLLAPSTAASSMLSGGPVNLTSGVFLYSPTSNVSGTPSVSLNFGTAEGFITHTSNLTMSGVLSGSGGLTLTAAYAPSASDVPSLKLTGANTYTGNTTINSGAIGFSGTVASGTAGAFGTGGTVILNAGMILSSLAPTSTTTFGLNISVIGNGQNYISPSTSGFTSTFNGNISLTNNLNLEGYTNAAASALIFNGTISGTGSLTDASYTYGVFNGNNTYSGGTILYGYSSSNASTYYAGSDTAFGTGTITFSGTSVLAGVGTAARTLANPLFLNATSYFGGTAPLTLTGTVTLNGTRTINVSNTALTTFGGVVANGALTKATGTGTLVLGSATGNTYTGGTVVSAGALLVTNTSGSGTGTGSVSVASGTTLGGTGFIVNTVPSGSTAATTSIASGGILQGGTGAATGALTLNGNLSLVSGSIIELGLDANGNASSLARGGGIWTLPSGIKFTFTGSPTVGQTYNNLLTGLAADPGTESGWTVTNSGFSGTFIYDGSGDIDLTMTTVPEPATVLGGVLTVGLLGRGLRRRPRAS